MQAPDLAPLATAEAVRIVRDITAAQLGAPTPCAEYTVRQLISHLLCWGPGLVGAATKSTVPPPGASEAETDLTTGDWAGDLTAYLERLGAAWAEPTAWDGMTSMGGSPEMPAAMIGGMVCLEVVVHGWDLARATGQQPRFDAELLSYVLDVAAKNADLGRDMGLFGPAVPIAESAPVLAQILGLTGRDPDWTA
jgi:uncharacterized protein (TIGR03086 family)